MLHTELPCLVLILNILVEDVTKVQISNSNSSSIEVLYGCGWQIMT